MARTFPTTEHILASLRSSPDQIAALTDGVAPARLRAAPAEGEWSAVEILAHLRACADMWGSAITRILTEEHPSFTAINPRSWIKQTDYPILEFAPSFAAFRAQRADLLASLAKLPPEDWQRTATVRVFHQSYERTSFFYAAWLARHERSHLKQIGQTIEAVRR